MNTRVKLKVSLNWRRTQFEGYRLFLMFQITPMIGLFGKTSQANIV